MSKIDIDDKNVVLIVADTLSAFHLPFYGYDRDTAPFLTDLAGKNLLVENAYTNAPWTAPSHASLFSGKLPSEHDVTTGSMMFDERSFVEDLSEEGYNTVGISANSLVSADLNFDRGFKSFHEVFDFDTENSQDLLRAAIKALKNPDIGTLRKGLKLIHSKITGGSSRGADTIEEITRKEIQAGDRPNFLFINYTDVHLPYNPPEEYAEQFTDNASEKISRHMKDHLNSEKPDIFYQGFPSCSDQELIDLYDSSIRYLDDKLESLYNYLNEELDDLVFIVTSDHGENFGEHGAYFHQCGIWEKSIRVPLIVAGDGIPNETVEENFSWRKLEKLILGGELETSETVYSEYAGWKEMASMQEENNTENFEGLKKKFSYNSSKAAIKQDKGLVINSHLKDFQFISDQRCHSEESDCFEDQEELETKIKIMLE
ncbi:sulfatase [Candidatus Nanohalovita haloferacivicina]|uniref:sulfatase n=1 Tax=Candidatus Nanohalovita haloferacivicina TaxID=2978046 RepID=UPI00325FA44C|nr:Arylsulfatase A family protein [Candidatus Nanohalobia archaeon BNXNv]